ncbi:unnamed protein product, partial [Polarella glacialis]
EDVLVRRDMSFGWSRSLRAVGPLLLLRLSIRSWSGALCLGGSALPSAPRARRVAMAAGHLEEALVWVDCEMTGLGADGGPGADALLEVACLITDGDLNLIAEGPDLVIHHSDAVLDSMNDWCKTQFGWLGAGTAPTPGLLADQ